MAELIPDGAVTFIAGQDASKSPHEVSEGGYFAGVNVSTQKGVLRPRWGLEKIRSLEFPPGGVARPNTEIQPYADLFFTGKFQGQVQYSVGNDQFLVVLISGQIFFIDVRTFVVQHIPVEGEQINPRTARLRKSPAGRFLVIFDFPAFPVIIDGITARRADPKKGEIPVSNIGGYNQNRLIIGNAGNEFTAGDPVGNTATPDAPITFLEFLTTGTGFFGQTFELNTNYSNDPITAIGFLQVSDVSTGIGPLIVATENAIYTYQTQQPRSAWTAGQFGTLLVYNAGVVGPRAIENLNSDMLFFSADGEARSIAMSRDEQGTWSKTPISREVRNWLKHTDQELLKHSFITYFNNKVFFSANPFRCSAKGQMGEDLVDYAFGGFAVLELDNISTLTKESPPVWAGLWTGCRPMEMTVVDKRAFVMSKDNGSLNQLYEMRPDLSYDVDQDSIRQVRAKLYTKDYDFKNPYQNKEIHSLDLSLQDVKGDFSIEVKYKPDQGVEFTPWGSFKHAAPWRLTRVPFVGLNGIAGHSFTNVNIGTPSNFPCNPVTKELLSTFRELQLELTIKGIYWELRGFKIKATVTQQSENITKCNYKDNIVVPVGCADDWQVGEFTKCQNTL
jgi:hypothetical protein